MALLVGICASACSAHRATHAKDAREPSVNPDPVTESKVAFELAPFASVQAGELATPISEAPPVVSRGASDGETRTTERGCGLGSRRVESSIQKHLPAIRACYEQQTRRAPKLAGKVTVSFVIRPNGHVEAAETIENSTGSPEVAACVSRGVRSIRFAESRGHGAVSCAYPFIFGTQR